jgi:hypothetical protein
LLRGTTKHTWLLRGTSEYILPLLLLLGRRTAHPEVTLLWAAELILLLLLLRWRAAHPEVTLL